MSKKAALSRRIAEEKRAGTYVRKQRKSAAAPGDADKAKPVVRKARKPKTADKELLPPKAKPVRKPRKKAMTPVAVTPLRPANLDVAVAEAYGPLEPNEPSAIYSTSLPTVEALNSESNETGRGHYALVKVNDNEVTAQRRCWVRLVAGNAINGIGRLLTADDCVRAGTDISRPYIRFAGGNFKEGTCARKCEVVDTSAL